MTKYKVESYDTDTVEVEADFIKVDGENNLLLVKSPFTTTVAMFARGHWTNVTEVKQ